MHSASPEQSVISPLAESGGYASTPYQTGEFRPGVTPLYDNGGQWVRIALGVCPSRTTMSGPESVPVGNLPHPIPGVRPMLGIPQLLSEFDHEMANTRKVLERLPEGKLSWKAHPKSNSIGWVGTHVANIPRWLVLTLQQESLDLAPSGGEPYQEVPRDSVGAILELFDQNVAAARSALAAAQEEALHQPWTLLRGGTVIFSMPRWMVIRLFVMNHLIHHRAHLCVYLRLNNIAVPGLYGPSADDAT